MLTPPFQCSNIFLVYSLTFLDIVTVLHKGRGAITGNLVSPHFSLLRDYVFCMQSSMVLGGGTGGGGSMAPPDFKIYTSPPPRSQHNKLISIGWK